MDLLDIPLRLAKKLYPTKYELNGQLDAAYTDTFDQRASDLIRDRLADRRPLMVSRFGSTELNCVVNYINQKDRSRYFKYLTGKASYYRWEKNVINNMSTLSGFFPKELSMFERFSEMMIADIQEIDILGSWLKEEALFSKQLRNAKRVGLLNLEPYNHQHPWSQELKGKSVLVVHPYDQSIQQQYSKRELLFSDKRVLPDFDLQTIKAVQSISNNETCFKNWFEALDYMKEQIGQRSFDVAIIGCGAYGLPLAAFVKRLGKKAIHLGGSTQLLFGIRGKRWENNYLDYNERLMNEHWTRPSHLEVPDNAKKVEDGCYW